MCVSVREVKGYQARGDESLRSFFTRDMDHLETFRRFVVSPSDPSRLLDSLFYPLISTPPTFLYSHICHHHHRHRLLLHQVQVVLEGLPQLDETHFFLKSKAAKRSGRLSPTIVPPPPSVRPQLLQLAATLRVEEFSQVLTVVEEDCYHDTGRLCRRTDVLNDFF